VKVELPRTTGEGKLETYATYTYGDAFSAGVDDAGAAGQGASQRLEFAFDSMEVSVGGAVATDTWTAPTA
jgi:type VI protein secretion system component Hcp